MTAPKTLAVVNRVKQLLYKVRPMSSRKRFVRGSNPRPSARKADVITATPTNHRTLGGADFQVLNLKTKIFKLYVQFHRLCTYFCILYCMLSICIRVAHKIIPELQERVGGDVRTRVYGASHGILE